MKSSSTRRSKTLFPDEGDEDKRQAAEPHADSSSSSSAKSLSKALFPDESDEDERQAVGPHALGSDTTSASSSEDDYEDERECAAPVAEVGGADAVADKDSAEIAVADGAEAAAADEVTESVAAADASVAVDDAVDASEIAAGAPESVCSPSVSTEASAAEAAVAEGSNKRKRDGDDDAEEPDAPNADDEEEKSAAVAEVDEDVQPLRLRKVYRSKSSKDVAGSSSAASRPPRNEASPSFASPSSMLSPMKDDSKRRPTPRKSRLAKKPQNLQSRLGATELTEKQVVKMIATLFEEQEQDDRDMYDILIQTVKEQTSQCERSDVVEELSQIEFRRMLTYGEVSVESVSSTILPFLKLQADDVFYDLGCGSGKIVIQAVLQTPCTVAKGIELMQNRVQKGVDALDRLLDKKLPVMENKTVDIVQGDICKPPEQANMMDATVVFINNVCFGPELMLRVMQMLSHMPKLRRVVTLRKFCMRHRPQKCSRASSLCVDYVHPPEEAEIFVSWASKTSVYLYERVAFSLGQLAAQLQLPSTIAAPEEQLSPSTSQEAL